MKFYNFSKNFILEHDPYLKKYVTTLVLEKKVSQAINVVKNNKNKNNTNFFDAYLLIILDSLKKSNFEKAAEDLMLHKIRILKYHQTNLKN